MNAKPAREVTGVRKGKKLQTQIGLDPDTHREVKKLASRAGISFAEQCRLLIEWGTESVHANFL